MEHKVDQSQWNALSEEERRTVQGIIGNFFKGDTIAPAPSAVASQGGTEALGGPWCKIACDVAQKAAETACNALPNPIARQICIIAADKAGDFCRSKC